MRSKKSDLVLSVVLLGISFFVYYSSLKMPKVAAQFPKYISIFLGVLSMILMIISLKKKEQENIKKQVNLVSVSLIVGALITYIIIINFTGYIISTFLLIFFIIYISGYSKFINVSIISALTVVFNYIIFKIILGVPLPMGNLFNF